MDRQKRFLDCCAAPNLETVKPIEMLYHDVELVRQCRSCHSYWFYKFQETISFGGETTK